MIWAFWGVESGGRTLKNVCLHEDLFLRTLQSCTAETVCQIETHRLDLHFCKENILGKH